MNAISVVKTFHGPGIINETRATLDALDRLGFEVDEIAINGCWRIGDTLVQLDRNVVGAPSRSFLLAPGVHVFPTDGATVMIVGTRVEPLP